MAGWYCAGSGGQIGPLSSPSSCTETCGRILSVPVNAPDIYAHTPRACTPRARLKAIRHRKLSVTWRRHHGPNHPPPPAVSRHFEYSWPIGTCFLLRGHATGEGIDWSLMRSVIITNVLLLSILICFNVLTWVSFVDSCRLLDTATNLAGISWIRLTVIKSFAMCRLVLIYYTLLIRY